MTNGLKNITKHQIQVLKSKVALVNLVEEKLNEAETEIQYLRTQVMNREMENENMEEQLRESNQ